jgi:RNA recognition motif-containing protein
MPTNCVWLDMMSETVSDKFLCMTFSRYGPVTYEVIDREQSKALVYYESLEVAQIAVNEMRGRALGGKKIQVRLMKSIVKSSIMKSIVKSSVVVNHYRCHNFIQCYRVYSCCKICFQNDPKIFKLLYFFSYDYCLKIFKQW